MIEGGYEGFDGEHRIRMVNFSRVLMYFIAVWIQIPLMSYDVMIVIVPLILGILDLAMAFWTIKPLTGLWIISFLVPIISILVATNTILHLLAAFTFSLHEDIMFLLSIGVILVSIVEINTLRKIGRFWIRKIDDNVSVSEIRTYDV